MYRFVMLISALLDFENALAICVIISWVTLGLSTLIWVYGKQPRAVRRDIIKVIGALRGRCDQ